MSVPYVLITETTEISLMPRTSRGIASKTPVKRGSRPASGKEVAKKAANLLVGCHVIPREAKTDVARALEAMVNGVSLALRVGRLVHIEIVFSSRGKIKLSTFVIGPAIRSRSLG